MLDKLSEQHTPNFTSGAVTHSARPMNLSNTLGKPALNHDKIGSSNNNNRIHLNTFPSNSTNSRIPQDLADEFSDFQSAPVISGTNHVKNSTSGLRPQLYTSVPSRNTKSAMLPFFPPINPPSSSNPMREGLHKQSAVGCRLANYDLGIPTASPRMSQQQQKHHTPIIQPQFTSFPQSFNQPQQQQQVLNGDNLLIGEEDKYSALRGIFDDISSNNLENSATMNSFESPPSIVPDKGSGYVSHRISLVSDDVLEIVKTESAEKPVDFGEFQSFQIESYENAKSYPSFPPSNTLVLGGQRNDFFDLNSKCNTNIETVGTPFVKFPANENLTLPTPIPAAAPLQQQHSSSLSDGEFGEFVSFCNVDSNATNTKAPSVPSPKIILKTESCSKKSLSGISVTKSKKSPHGATKINPTRIAKASNILIDSPTPTYPKLPDFSQASSGDQNLFGGFDYISAPAEPPPPFVSESVMSGDFDFDMPLPYYDSAISKVEFTAPLKTTLIGSRSDNVDGFGEFAKAHQVSSIDSQFPSKINSLDLLPFQKQVKTHCSGETHSLSSLDLGTYVEFGDGKGSVDIEDSPDLAEILEFGSYDSGNVMDERNSDIMQSPLHTNSCFPTTPARISDSPVSICSNQGNDKYKIFKDELENERERYSSEWSRCLISCLKLISFSHSILNMASSSDVVREVLLSEQGNIYIKNLVDVYLVASRINRSCKKLGGAQKVQHIFDEITAVWELMLPFLSGTPLTEHINTVSEWSEGEYSDCSKVCGLCLINLEEEDQESLLDYGGKYYHPTCANLWINKVDSILPSLYCVSLL